jgi:hypothetical protein
MVVEYKSSDLDRPLAARGRLNQKRTHHRALAIPNRFNFPDPVAT